MEKWTKEQIKRTKITISKNAYIEDTQRIHSERLSLKIASYFVCEW